MALWRIMLAIWLIISGIVWFTGPTFPGAFAIVGISGILAAIFLLINKGDTV